VHVGTLSELSLRPLNRELHGFADACVVGEDGDLALGGERSYLIGEGVVLETLLEVVLVVAEGLLVNQADTHGLIDWTPAHRLELARQLC